MAQSQLLMYTCFGPPCSFFSHILSFFQRVMCHPSSDPVAVLQALLPSLVRVAVTSPVGCGFSFSFSPSWFWNSYSALAIPRPKPRRGTDVRKEGPFRTLSSPPTTYGLLYWIGLWWWAGKDVFAFACPLLTTRWGLRWCEGGRGEFSLPLPLLTAAPVGEL